MDSQTHQPDPVFSLPGNRDEKPGRSRALIVHILLWAVFLSIPTFFNSRRFGQGPSKFLYDLLEPPRLSNAVFLIAVFYFNTLIAIPRFYFRHRYPQLALSLIVAAAAFYGLNYAISPPDLRQVPGFSPLGNSFNLFMFIIVYTVSFVYCLYQQYQKIKDDRLNTRISLLTAQMNPHFLFNTLNSIYSLSLMKSDKVSDAIVKLSGIMRYSIGEGSRRIVPISGELGYIRDYIQLQKLRLTGEVSVSFETEGREQGVNMAPFLFIPFVENAFKHGVNGQTPSGIAIRVVIRNSEVCFSVSNTKVETRERPRSTGLGIRSTRERLELLYPGRFNLELTDDGHRFLVELKIDLA